MVSLQSSAVECCIVLKHARTHTYTRARADLEEAKGEKEGEDVDSPSGDRNRIVRRDTASCSRLTANSSLKVSPYRRWTGMVDLIGYAKQREIVLCVCCFLIGVIPRHGRDYAAEESDA